MRQNRKKDVKKHQKLSKIRKKSSKTTANT